MNALVVDFFERHGLAQDVYQVGNDLFLNRGSAESAGAGSKVEHYTRKQYDAHLASEKKNPDGTQPAANGGKTSGK